MKKNLNLFDIDMKNLKNSKSFKAELRGFSQRLVIYGKNLL